MNTSHQWDLAYRSHKPRQATWWLVYDKNTDLVISKHKTPGKALKALQGYQRKQKRGDPIVIRVSQEEWAW